MRRLTRDRADRARDQVGRIAGRAVDLATLWTDTTQVFADTVPFYWTPCYYTLDPASLLITSHFHDGLAEFPREWLEAEYYSDDVHLLVDLARAESDVSTLHDVTGGDPSGTRRWQMNMRMGGDQEMLVRLRARSGEVWGAIGLYREPGRPMFDAAERDFVSAVAPILAEGVRRALLLGEATAPEWPDAPGLLILDGAGGVVSTSPAVEVWLEQLPRVRSGALPAAVHAVATRALQSAAPHGGAGEVAMARVLTRTGAWVVLHGAPLGSAEERRVAVIIEPAHPARILPLLMSAYGLTEREREVVGLVLQGLSTNDVADTLVVSVHTVQQHLKHIFDKTGVHSRRDLVARVFFSHYEPRFRDNERRTGRGEPLRGGPAVPDGVRPGSSKVPVTGLTDA